METANAQAQAIVKKAEERARILVSEAEIVKAAQQRAGEITTAAQNEARTLRQTVTDYCDNMLKNTEETMVENAAQVKNVRANLRQKRQEKTAEDSLFHTQITHTAKTKSSCRQKMTADRDFFLLHFAAKTGAQTLQSRGLSLFKIKTVSSGKSVRCVHSARNTESL